MVPLDVATEFHETEYGETVSSTPIMTPFTLKVTPASALLSLAVAARLTIPETVAPPVGAVSETVGGVTSASVTVTLLLHVVVAVRGPEIMTT